MTVHFNLHLQLEERPIYVSFVYISTCATIFHAHLTLCKYAFCMKNSKLLMLRVFVRLASALYPKKTFHSKCSCSLFPQQFPTSFEALASSCFLFDWLVFNAAENSHQYLEGWNSFFVAQTKLYSFMGGREVQTSKCLGKQFQCSNKSCT